MNKYFTEDELDLLNGPMDLYGSDKQIIIYEDYGDKDFTDRLEQYCEANNYEWNYSDAVIEDFETETAYQDDGFGSYLNVIIDNLCFGRSGFEDGTYDWYTISDTY